MDDLKTDFRPLSWASTKWPLLIALEKKTKKKRTALECRVCLNKCFNFEGSKTNQWFSSHGLSASADISRLAQRLAVQVVLQQTHRQAL